MISFQAGCLTQKGWLNSIQCYVSISLYNVVKQELTHHFHIFKTSRQRWEVILISNVAGFWFPHEQQIICYGNEEYLHYHNTKYIFWLGKNNFIV
jgi:hypothetical protein